MRTNWCKMSEHCLCLQASEGYLHTSSSVKVTAVLQASAGARQIDVPLGGQPQGCAPPQ